MAAATVKRKAESVGDVKILSVVSVTTDELNTKRKCNPFYYTSMWAKRVSYQNDRPLLTAAKDLGRAQFSRLNGAKFLSRRFVGARVVSDKQTIGTELYHEKKWWSFENYMIPAKFVGQTVVGVVFDDSEGWVRVGIQFNHDILWNEDSTV